MKRSRGTNTGFAKGIRYLSATLAVAVSVGCLSPVLSSEAHAQTPTLAEVHPSNDYTDAIAAARTIVREMMEADGVPGASLAVGVGDQIVWSEGFGWANLEQGVPVTPLTKFRIGSVSKTMTASAIGVLVERGQLDLDAEVQTYVPDFPRKRWTVTPRQLGGHLAGVRHYVGNEMMSSRNYPTVAEGLEIFDDDPLLHEPGTQYQYSSYGWNLLSAVMEGASGTPFLELVREEVFEPLGLRHTVPDHNDSIVVHRTEFYEHGRGGAVVNAPYVDNSYKWAGGGFLSTPEDLIRFGQAHLRPGFLKAETLMLLMTSQDLSDGSETNYGIGWVSAMQSDGDRTVSHSGGSVGGTTLLLLVPKHDLVIAGVVNISGSAPAIVRRVAEAFEAHMR